MPAKPSRMRALAEGLYRYHYLLGMQIVLRLHRWGRRIRRVTAPAVQSLRYLWRRWIQLPLHRQRRKLLSVIRRVPQAHRELREAAHSGVGAWFACWRGLFRRAGAHYREELLSLWSLVGPATAVVVLLVTVSVWANTRFCLSLTYQEQPLGYIADAGTYDAAAAMAMGRVVNVDNSFSVESVPRLAVTIQKGQEVLDDAQLCDAILRTAGDSIAEATGMYVDNAFIGAMESPD